MASAPAALSAGSGGCVRLDDGRQDSGARHEIPGERRAGGDDACEERDGDQSLESLPRRCRNRVETSPRGRSRVPRHRDHPEAARRPQHRLSHDGDCGRRLPERPRQREPSGRDACRAQPRPPQRDGGAGGHDRQRGQRQRQDDPARRGPQASGDAQQDLRPTVFLDRRRADRANPTCRARRSHPARDATRRQRRRSERGAPRASVPPSRSAANGATSTIRPRRPLRCGRRRGAAWPTRNRERRTPTPSTGSG